MAGRTAAPRLRCSGGIWYECSRRKVKKLNLRVRRDGSVAVSIPLRMDWAQADRFVAEQAQWIAEAQARQLARAERQTETLLPPKEVALAYFTAMSDAVYPAFAKVLGGQKPTIKVRSMVSRWGVCAMAKRQITFALQLYNMPPAAQIYVVVPHWVSGKILYSGTCHWRSFVCNFDLSLLCYRNCGIFLETQCGVLKSCQTRVPVQRLPASGTYSNVFP